jgi:hypothetical protein
MLKNGLLGRFVHGLDPKGFNALLTVCKRPTKPPHGFATVIFPNTSVKIRCFFESQFEWRLEKFQSIKRSMDSVGVRGISVINPDVT